MLRVIVWAVRSILGKQWAVIGCVGGRWVWIGILLWNRLLCLESSWQVYNGYQSTPIFSLNISARILYRFIRLSLNSLFLLFTDYSSHSHCFPVHINCTLSQSVVSDVMFFKISTPRPFLQSTHILRCLFSLVLIEDINGTVLIRPIFLIVVSSF